MSPDIRMAKSLQKFKKKKKKKGDGTVLILMKESLTHQLLPLCHLRFILDGGLYSNEHFELLR